MKHYTVLVNNAGGHWREHTTVGWSVDKEDIEAQMNKAKEVWPEYQWAIIEVEN